MVSADSYAEQTYDKQNKVRFFHWQNFIIHILNAYITVNLPIWENYLLITRRPTTRHTSKHTDPTTAPMITYTLPVSELPVKTEKKTKIGKKFLTIWTVLINILHVVSF
jgi:hypothetical protein